MDAASQAQRLQWAHQDKMSDRQITIKTYFAVIQLKRKIKNFEFFCGCLKPKPEV